MKYHVKAKFFLETKFLKINPMFNLFLQHFNGLVQEVHELHMKREDLLEFLSKSNKLLKKRG